MEKDVTISSLLSMKKNMHDKMESAGFKGRIKKAGIFSLFRAYSEEFPLLTLNIHGLTLVSGKKLHEGERIMLHLQTPQGFSLDLHSVVVNLKREGGHRFEIVTLKFLPFGEGCLNHL